MTGDGTITYVATIIVAEERSFKLDELENTYGFPPDGLSVDEMLTRMADLDNDTGDVIDQVAFMMEKPETKVTIRYREGGFDI